MEILGLLVVLVAAYWAKNNLLKHDTSKAIDDSCRRAVNSVKKMLSNKTENVSELPEQQDVVAPVVEKQSPVVDEHLSQSNKVTQNIAAPAEAVSQTVVAKKSSAKVLNPVPEDSVLKRHYQTQLVAERSSITHPYPTDSVLRRHYEAKLQAAFNLVSTAPKADAVELVVEAIDQVSPVTTTNQQNFPEDSVLKRHFTQLIEASEAA
ncbi:MAG: hypothetical protein PHR94_15010 [Methylomonas lenta]|nr:hypothetical protein [Methylomonas lenta]